MSTRKCQYYKCTKVPKFNIAGENPLFCKMHKSDNMINVTAIPLKCIHKGCETRPVFNHVGETYGIYCRKHKATDMINVADKKCEHPGCNKLPSFNFEGKFPMYCYVHASLDMVDVKNKNKRCQHVGCMRQANFSVCGSKERGMYCSSHSSAGMSNVSGGVCAHKGCTKYPCFNFAGETKALYCRDHKICPKMINVRTKLCLTVDCPRVRVVKKYGGYCLQCFMRLVSHIPEIHMNDLILAA